MLLTPSFMGLFHLWNGFASFKIALYLLERIVIGFKANIKFLNLTLSESLTDFFFS